MALAFEIDTLEGVEESIQALYVEREGKFRLDVSGIDPADELKEALVKERALNKANELARKDAEKTSQEALLKIASEKGNHEEVAASYKKQLDELRQENADQRAKTINEKLDNIALSEAASNANTPANAKLLQYFIRQELKYNDDDTITDNEGFTVAQIIERMSNSGSYESLWKGSEATGGGATGSKSGGATKSLRDMSATEEAAFANLNPDAYKQMINRG